MKKKSIKMIIFLIVSVFFSGCLFQTNKSASKLVENEVKKNDEILNIVQKAEKKRMVHILFLGDLMFDRYIRKIAEKNGNDFVFEKTTNLLKDNDLVVLNLEGPITDNTSKSVDTLPEQKGHFIFTFDKSLVKTLSDYNIKLVNLGNNHILNFGENGLAQTKKYLTESGVEYFGDPKNDKNYFIKEIDEFKVCFVGYNQFGGSAEKTISSIKEIKDKVDIVAVYAHWGKEYEKNPSDSIRNLAHSFVDAGADFIIGSHPHVVQEKEEYKGKRIYYSLGNFIFDQYFSEETMRGLAVKVKINQEDKSLEFKEAPLFLEKNGQVLSK